MHARAGAGKSTERCQGVLGGCCLPGDCCLLVDAGHVLRCRGAVVLWDTGGAKLLELVLYGKKHAMPGKTATEHKGFP